MSIAYKKNGSWVTASGTPPIDDFLSVTSKNAVQNKIVKTALATHNHDGRYYTKGESDTIVSGLQSNFQAGVDDIYDAVVAKGSTPASKSLSDVVAGIGNISTGIQPSGTINISQNGDVDVTNYSTASVSVPTPTGNASEGDVLASKTFSNSSGVNKTGTMTNRGAVSQTLDTSITSYTIPEGYHNGSGKVSITTQEKTVTPSTSAQSVTPDSGKVLSKVTVNAMAATLTKFSQIRAAVNGTEYTTSSSSSLRINFLKQNLLYIIVHSGNYGGLASRQNVVLVNNNNDSSIDHNINMSSWYYCKILYLQQGASSGYITISGMAGVRIYVFVIPMDY
jgi:hypothetical protein